MNILIIHEIDWLRKVVFELQTLADMLAQDGHNVYALDYESMWEKDSFLDFGTLRTREINTSITLVRPGFIKIPLISRISASVSHYGAIHKILHEKQIDVILLYSVPTNGMQTLRLAKKYGVPVVFRSIDNLHRLVANPILSRITYQMEKRVYANVDMILTISPKLSEYVVELGASPNKVKLLPVGVDTNLFRPCINTKKMRDKWGISDNDKVVVFVGTLPLFSGLDVFIPKFKYVVNKYPRAKLIIVGDGEQREMLEAIIKTLGMEDSVIITGLQPYEDIPKYINMADVCINTFPVSGPTKDAFPTKIIQYMACGKPVLSYPLLGMKGLGQGQGIIYPDGEMENELIYLLRCTQRRRLGQAALEYVRQEHSYSRIVGQLETMLVGVILK